MSEDIHDQMIDFLPRLRRFAYSLTGNIDKGDDLVQDTCERALSRAHQLRPGTRLSSWMFRIAQNMWIDQVRERNVRGELTDIEHVEHHHAVDGREVMESRSELARVCEGMVFLTPEQQVVIALVCVDELSYGEAAEIIGVPIGTVMSRLSRARKKLAGNL